LRSRIVSSVWSLESISHDLEVEDEYVTAARKDEEIIVTAASYKIVHHLHVMSGVGVDEGQVVGSGGTTVYEHLSTVLIAGDIFTG